MPGRSPAAYAIQAPHLGIARDSGGSDDEDDRLKAFDPTPGQDVAAKIPEKTKHLLPHKSSRPQIEQQEAVE